MKPCTYDWLMGQDLEAIERLCPFGAVKLPSLRKGAPDRFLPATEASEANVSLRKLLRDKKKRMHQTRIPHKDSSKGYTETTYMGMHHEPESPSKADTDRYAQEARERFRATHVESERQIVMRSRLARLRQLGIDYVKEGADVDTALEKAWERMRREKKAA